MDFFNLKQGNKLLGKPHLLHVIYMSDTGLNALHKLPNLIFKSLYTEVQGFICLFKTYCWFIWTVLDTVDIAMNSITYFLSMELHSGEGDRQHGIYKRKIEGYKQIPEDD